MCGIAGYSFSFESAVDRTVAARALLAGIAERGADSVGFAYRGDDSKVTVHKQRTGASELIDRIEVSQTATQRSSGSTTARSPMTTSCSQPMASREPSPV
jgi:glucosamine 6-phosphate synthetase-like amidotransferase/phosphosugar isomerase protein